MNKKILCVDDEPNILEAYKRNLRKDYDIHIAQSGAEGLALIANDGPFGVIVSDMRMPEMNGIQFLQRAKQIAPESVTIMLTGNLDQQTAMSAVNEGSIFRFLTKPCPPEALAIALDAGLEQYRLVTAEKHLLEQTLNKSLQVLVEILAIVNPTAFSRSTRVKKMVREIADRLELAKSWEVEIAGMLSQIGCVTVPEEILLKNASGSPLSDRETGLYHQHPQVGHDLIARIPRMETVAEIVLSQNEHFDVGDVLNLDDPRKSAIVGARILKVVLDYDRLISSDNSPRNALSKLSERIGWYDPQILNILRNIIEVSTDEFVDLEVSVSDLKPGMMLDKPLMSVRGSTLLSPGQEITMSLILRLVNLSETGIIADKVRVSVPISQVPTTATAQAN